MKKDVKFILVAYLLPVLMIFQAFFLTSVSHAEKTGKTNNYSVVIDLKIHEWDSDKNSQNAETSEKESSGYIFKSSERQVMYWRIDKKLNLDPDNLDDNKKIELQKKYDGLSIDKINEEFGEAKLSDKSKLVFNDKLYDSIDFDSTEFSDVDGKQKVRASISAERIVIKDLEKGVYLFKETDESRKKASEKFKPSKLVTSVVSISGEKNVIPVDMKSTEEVPTKDITLIKVDEDDENIKLDKVGFKLFRKDDKKNKTDPDTYSLVPVKKQETGTYYEYDPSNTKGDNILRTNTDGKIVVKGLPEGEYYFEEVETIEGYDPQFNIGRNNKDKPIKLGGSVTITNKRIPSLIKYVKDTDTTLDGVTFAVYKKGSEEKINFKEGKNPGEYIYDEAGKLTDIETKAKGRIYLLEMPKGDYYFKEITAIEGYKKSEDSFEFSVDENHKILVNGKVDSVKVPNSPETPNPPPENPKGSHKFIKVDKDDHGKKLSDAKFKVQKLIDSKFRTVLINGEVLFVKSDENGNIELKDLEYGHYRLVEVGYPENYKAVAKDTEFDIDASSSLNTPILIENEYQPPKEETPPPITPSTPTKIITNRSRGPMVKTGDIRIWIYFAIGLLMIIGGSLIVRREDRKQLA